MKHTEIKDRLITGNERFVKDKLKGANANSKRREAILEGQDPFAIVLSCADSRVVPELIFDTGIGELFVVRVAGNIANIDSIASIEYAVAHLHTKMIIVLAHQNCGAVTAAVAGGENGKNINHLLAHIKPAINTCSDNASVDEIARNNALHSGQDLITKSSIISEALDAGELEILAAYYNLDSGKVEFL